MCFITQQFSDRSIYFVHNPRTAGRHVKDLFHSSRYRVRDYRIYYSKDYEFMHAPIKVIKKFEVFSNPNINFFTVIRNPITRFKSGFKQFFMGLNEQQIKKILKDLDDEENFKNLMDKEKIVEFDKERDVRRKKYGLVNLTNNHFTLQKFYVDDSVKVWKYEDGFGEEFKQWIRNNFDFNVKLSERKYEKLSYDDIEFELSDKIKENIYNYYKEDFELFDYDRI